MELERLYRNYLNLKFGLGLPLLNTAPFEYGLCEDGSYELFMDGLESHAFSEWTSGLTPADPRYSDPADRKPVLAAQFSELDVYDEQVLGFLLLTVNMTTSVFPVNAYNRMNDFMKQYCFFQLAQCSGLTQLEDKQKNSLRDFFFWFYLYAHPVNGETLEAFSFRGPGLIHTETGVLVRKYFEAYHTYYARHHTTVMDSRSLTATRINACSELTLQLLDVVEGQSSVLFFPPQNGLEPALRLINHVDQYIAAFGRHSYAGFVVMRELLAQGPSTPYREQVISVLLQNYVCYILYFDFSRITELVEFFRDDPPRCEMILNRMFTETIFIQKILRKNEIDLRNYPHVTSLFNEHTRKMYGLE